jgi:hypothetical protein
LGVVQLLEDVTRKFITTEEKDVERLPCDIGAVEMNLPAGF